MDTTEWATEYDRLSKELPPEGAILRSIDAENKVKLFVELTDGSPPFIYGIAFFPSVVNDPLQWFLIATDSQQTSGLRCILTSKSRSEVIRRFGVASTIVTVKSLQVIKKSSTGRSLLCEIHEW